MARPLWVCPKCGNRFVTRNLWHSCVRIPLNSHFQGKPPVVRKTYQAWLAAARVCGPVRVISQKTRIAFQVRVRFGGAVIRAKSVEGGLWLTRRTKHPLLIRTETPVPGCHVHRFRLRSPEDVDDALRQLMRESYAVGRQEPWNH